MPDWEARRLEQIEEYSTYVAAEDIDAAPGVRAYNIGDPVPVSNVKLHGYDKTGQVRRVDGGPAKAHRQPKAATPSGRVDQRAPESQTPTGEK
jgi:hypothetical protein